MDNRLIKRHSLSVEAQVKSQVCEIRWATTESAPELILSDTVNEMCSITAMTEALRGMNSVSSWWSPLSEYNTIQNWRSWTAWNPAFHARSRSFVLCLLWNHWPWQLAAKEPMTDTTFPHTRHLRNVVLFSPASLFQCHKIHQDGFLGILVRQDS